MSYYKWTSPCEWLFDASFGWSAEVLRMNLLILALRSDSDMLETIFREDMNKDGYFEREKE